MPQFLWKKWKRKRNERGSIGRDYNNASQLYLEKLLVKKLTAATASKALFQKQHISAQFAFYLTQTNKISALLFN